MTIGADRLLDVLLANGLDLCFANPGTSEMHFVAALDRRPEMRCVLGLFEGVVTGMADGYGRLTGNPAATLLHTGPGLANGLANLHNARRAATPVLNVVGDHASYHLAYGAPLASDIDAVAAPMSDWVGRATSPDAVAETTRRALAAACAPGVATMILPADSSWGDAPVGTGDDVIERPVPSPPDEARIAEVADAIRRHAGRFAILVGGAGALRQGVVAAGRVAAACEGRVLGEVLPPRIAQGRDVPPVPCIPYPIDQSLAVLADVDLLVLAGAKEPVAFFAYPDKPSSLMAEGCRAMALAAPGEDVLAALAMLADRFGAEDGAGVPEVEPFTTDLASEETLTAAAVCEVVAALLPDGAIVADEGLTSVARLGEIAGRAAPHERLSIPGGSIGIGPPLAAGAAIGAPERKVVNLQADGSAAYTLQALWTQARERLDVVTVLFANRTYAILHWELANLGYGKAGPNAARMFDLEDPHLDWVKLSEGMGVEAVRATTRRGFAEALKAALGRRGPMLIECVI